MLFSSYGFLLVFFPVVTIGYWGLHRMRLHEIAKIWLIFASFYFYAQGSPDFFPFFLGSVLVNYGLGITMCKLQGEENRLQRRLILAMGVLGNVGLLGYYKYMNFFLGNLNRLAGTDFVLKQLILPIGISFFTFQLIAFLVDCCRGRTKQYELTEYLLFITFFPQLIVGPIVHHAEITPQFENEDNRKLKYENIALGIFFFAVGCGKKMLLADPMNQSAGVFYTSISEHITMWESWYHTLEYSLSYYFDLSGYTDMAIGLALFYNIHLPDNFHAPWKARNMQEYWQRQHMTLSRFLGGYVFKSYYKKGCVWRNYYIATIVTFLVSGIWHGAGWNFIIWGLMNGVLVCIGAWQSFHKKHPPYLLGVILTFFCVILTRVIFVAESMKDTFVVYRTMFDFSKISAMGWENAVHECTKFISSQGKNTILILAGLLICWFAPTTREMSKKFQPNVRYFLFAAVLLAVCTLKMNQVVQFLYFQF